MGFMREAVNALILREESLLLFKKNLVWILPGGKPKEGESDIESLIREFREEASGAEIVPDIYYGSFTGKTPHTGDELRALVYFARLKQSNQEIVPSGEINEGKFAGYFDVFNLNLSDITRKVVSCLIKEGYF